MSAFSGIDHAHMAHALRLAERGLYTTQPNPRVGCVIAHGDEVVGEGWHQRAGEPHAEVFALRQAGERARDATAYVTLEPCAHHGRTPPCADALIASGVARVVIAAEDPFPQVAGRGIEKLRAVGIAVDIGLMREAARELNIGFFSRIERGRPWLRVKLAMSLDGRTALANGESKWITGEAARADVQRWRARSSAILTGSGTVLADNPQLTVRLPQGEAFTPALRVVLDRQLRTPVGSHVLDGSAPTLLLHASGVDPDHRFQHVECASVAEQDGALDLSAALTLLAERGCNEVHVEAGPTLCGALFAAGLVDELLIYVAPLLLGDSAHPLLHLPTLGDMAERWQLRPVEQRQLGNDWRLRLRPP
ncbi:bifunctional diaminohydroxyphosphoribosylaminopyrimidine deaminase/5-amino-6-(5-phosphoribosylamino)uracil reductase RibD [Rhodanobacter sp. MP7CTX1]|jgi:diaminohydroxyphosphoribosylaminopyrimidine deaminase / 5-amino-6-(5-phosphoribosylamino)uracil reductase|uniref:bifunctional diaminohydroxyphosphoribosylaminopyrimidine deaminase/5-amino-6-(5-phosphoribosylamino)uracil reductase RibD n=1 Tax=Rhodanobacter sp. MP7CTX1 TaxID=2723084 RepID=UPI00182F54B1|nr:bifunctional diaminohydroxyphosphoribosylaminopyrimidine deaminase/5-amino-6-(5-phosphoribosylamino)uracil reductase RibD [Rhodanobacter sp. MP7CTX1]MBB6187389.1 diaminohydroxyphosphoribosylaminopyrimidine deaminase/5-amino-6-(5-phosphoribosylamino)uracil reductase [Rhodanobacter sp. MP7CTX1]